MNDPRISALAAAIRDNSYEIRPYRGAWVRPYDAASAILALLRSCPEEGHYVTGCKCWALVATAEIARLRKIEEIASDLDKWGYLDQISKLTVDGENLIAALRAALEDER
jgi:hypothetical protein